MARWVVDLSTPRVGILLINRDWCKLWHQFELPSDVYYNGMIIDVSAASAYLKEQIKQTGLRIKRPVLVLSPTSAVEMQLSLPAAVSKRELPGAVKNAVARQLGGQLYDTTLQWVRTHKGRLSQKIYVAAVRKAPVEAAKAMLEGAGIRPSRVLPFYLALSGLLEGRDGVLVYGDERGEVFLVGSEYRAPAVSGGLGVYSNVYGAESRLATKFHSALNAADDASPLRRTQEVSVLSFDENLVRAFQASGYEAEMMPRPVGCPESVPITGSSLNIPWPEAAVAYGAAQTLRYGVGRKVNAAKVELDMNIVSRQVMAAFLAAFLAAEVGGLAYFSRTVWPTQVAEATGYKTEAERLWEQAAQDQQKVDQYLFLKEQNEKYARQFAGLTQKAFNWERLYEELTAATPSGITFSNVEVEGITAEDKASDFDPENVILSLSGTADQIGTLRELMNALARAPFETPLLTRTRQVSTSRAPSDPVIIQPAAPPTQAQPPPTTDPNAGHEDDGETAEEIVVEPEPEPEILAPAYVYEFAIKVRLCLPSETQGAESAEGHMPGPE